MKSLIPRDNVFQNLFDFRRDFDHLFSRMLNNGSSGDGYQNNTWLTAAPAVDLYIDKVSRKVCCRVALPGIDPNQVQIHTQGNTIAIRGERNMDVAGNEVEWVNSEIWYGPFERSITLPEGVETGKLTAEYRNGMLEMTAPLSDSVLPQRIEIKSAASAPALRAVGAQA